MATLVTLPSALVGERRRQIDFLQLEGKSCLAQRDMGRQGAGARSVEKLHRSISFRKNGCWADAGDARYWCPSANQPTVKKDDDDARWGLLPLAVERDGRERGRRYRAGQSDAEDAKSGRRDQKASQ